MQLNELRCVVGCHDSIKIMGLNLIEPSPRPSVMAISEGLAELKRSLVQRKTAAETLASVKKAIYAFYSDENAVSLVAERDATLEQIERMVNYFYFRGFDAAKIEADAVLKYRFKDCLTIPGCTDVNEVTTKADLVISLPNGEKRAVRFMYGEQPYTDWKGSKNHMSLVPELAVMYLAFKQKGKDVIPELWYLKGKDDKAGTPLPKFEVRELKNIARWKYRSEDEALSALREFVKKPEEADKCENCVYADICRQTAYTDVKRITKREHTGGTPQFTEEQRAVIEHRDGPAAVIAVPGSGKTFTIAYRFKQLVESGVDPASILCITFTASAAKDMEERIRQIAGVKDELSVTTFHSFGYGILIDNPLLVGKRVKLADETDRKLILEQALNECPRIVGQSYVNMRAPHGTINQLTYKFRSIQDDGIEAFHNRFDAKCDTEGILRVYNRVQEMLEEGGYITFDEQIELTNKLFRKYPKILDVLAEQYRYIMVDEYQDTSEEQKELIYALARRHNNIMVVGDDDQSIYGFRGGSNRFLLDFPKEFKGAKVFRLTKNFRSVSHILQVANAVMDGVEDRYQKELTTDRIAENRVYYHFGSERTVIDYVLEFLKKFKYTPSDICILARKNESLERVRNALAMEGIESTAPKDRLVDDPVFNIVMTILKLKSDIDDDHALARLFRWYAVPIPVKTAANDSLYRDLVRRSVVEPYDVCDTGKATDDPVRKVICSLYKMMRILDDERLTEAIKKIGELLLIPENYMVLQEIEEKIGLKGLLSPAELLSHMEQMQEYGDTARVIYDVDKNKVRLVTEHDSKGHEYPAVIICGMEDFEVEKPEDRRLLYVSITRAKNVLVMIEDVGPRRFEGYEWIEPYVITRGA